MQLTEEEIFAIACKEGDQEKHGFIFNKDGRWSVISFARALEAALRAQADARPVARFHFDEAELDALYEAIEWAKDEGLPGTAEHLQAIFDAHNPEASAPGLSEFEIRDLAVKYCAYETDGKCYNIVRYEIEEDFFNFCRALISLGLTRASAATASPDARIEELRKGLFEARDAMRVMSNWVKQSDPAGHSWGVRMVDRANAVLSGSSAATVAEPSDDIERGGDAYGEAQEYAASLRAIAQREQEERAAQKQDEPSLSEAFTASGLTPTRENRRAFMLGFDAHRRSTQQQAEPGVDEIPDAVAMAFHRALTDDAAVSPSELQEIKVGLHAAFLAASQARAAQSGQRAGVAADAARFVFMIEGALADIRGDELTPQQQAMREALMHPELQTLDDVRARIDTARAAAPTQQQEGE